MRMMFVLGVVLGLAPMVATSWAQSPPTNVQAIRQGATTAEITWSPGLRVDGYYVQRGGSTSGPWTRISSYLPVPATAYSDAAAPAGQLVCYRVEGVAVRDFELGGKWVSANVQVGPRGPSDLTATVTTSDLGQTRQGLAAHDGGGGSISTKPAAVLLQWKPDPGTPGYAVSGYRVARGVVDNAGRAGSVEQKTITGPATSFTDTGLTKGTKYRYYLYENYAAAVPPTSLRASPVEVTIP